MKNLLLIVVVLILGAGAFWYFSGASASGPQPYRTAKVDKGSLAITVTATGTLQAVTTVQVGTQVSGVVDKLFVDFNDRVKEGQIVAQLDTDLLDVRLAQDRASVIQAEANLAKLEVDRADAQRNLNRQKELFEKKIASQTDLDSAQYRLDASDVSIRIAQTAIKQAQTAVSASEINLKHATITSPISGVVISRSVDVGQTVAASLSAPTLFTIANDLSKMWVLANIDEADIGKIVEAQPVTFGVDSFPDKEFKGKVRQVRLQPTTVQNVVMYTVVIDVDNSSGLLLPGMTANLNVLVDQATDVIRVPNAALRFQPAGEIATSMGAAPASMGQRPTDSGDKGKRPGPGNGHGKGKGNAFPEEVGKPGKVYLLVNGSPKANPVRIGRSDGAFTEILSGELKEGDEVIIGGGLPANFTSNSSQGSRAPWSGGRR